MSRNSMTCPSFLKPPDSPVFLNATVTQEKGEALLCQCAQHLSLNSQPRGGNGYDTEQDRAFCLYCIGDQLLVSQEPGGTGLPGIKGEAWG